MKNIILASLAAATVLTPIATQAADTTSASARGSLSSGSDISSQRDEGRWGEGRRGGEYRQQRAPENTQRNWSQERNRSDRQRSEIGIQRRSDVRQDSRYYDRSREGTLDSRYDRNRDENRDRRYDRYRNDYIDRQYDRDNGNRSGRWNDNWRNENRYDWRGHRERYGNYYRPGRYYSPYRGRSYSRMSVGFSLGSGYYNSRYWINDPWAYRLPAVHGSYRWVRYYSDVLLVDVRNGRVVDVIRDFFW
jgi:uncharacterized low-complexity protein